MLLVNPDDCPENMAWLTGMSLGISIQSITMLEPLEMFMLVLYVEDHTLDMNYACLQLPGYFCTQDQGIIDA